MLLATILPWLVYGATIVAVNSTTDNPTPNVNGVVGEISSLPYTVPAGYELVITGMGIEGPTQPVVSGAIWLGSLPRTNAKWLISCTTIGGSLQNTNLNFILPAGTIVNVSITNGSPYAWCDGWYVQGYLQPYP